MRVPSHNPWRAGQGRGQRGLGTQVPALLSAPRLSSLVESPTLLCRLPQGDETKPNKVGAAPYAQRSGSWSTVTSTPPSSRYVHTTRSRTGGGKVGKRDALCVCAGALPPKKSKNGLGNAIKKCENVLDRNGDPKGKCVRSERSGVVAPPRCCGLGPQRGTKPPKSALVPNEEPSCGTPARARLPSLSRSLWLWICR